MARKHVIQDVAMLYSSLLKTHNISICQKKMKQSILFINFAKSQAIAIPRNNAQGALRCSSQIVRAICGCEVGHEKCERCGPANLA
jgi:hypothetical protein